MRVASKPAMDADKTEPWSRLRRRSSEDNKLVQVMQLRPVREYTEQQTSEPMTVVVYPGADGTFALYEDDGRSLDYRQGAQMRIAMRWNDAARRLSLGLAPRSKMLPPMTRPIRLRIAGTKEEKAIEFAGKPIEVRF